MSLKSEFIPVQFKITSRFIIELWGKVGGGGGGFPPAPIKFPKISISNIINTALIVLVTVDKNKPWILTPPPPSTPMKQNYPLGTPLPSLVKILDPCIELRCLGVLFCGWIHEVLLKKWIKYGLYLKSSALMTKHKILTLFKHGSALVSLG